MGLCWGLLGEGKPCHPRHTWVLLSVWLMGNGKKTGRVWIVCFLLLSFWFIANEEDIFFFMCGFRIFLSFFLRFSRQSNGALLNWWWLMCLYSITSIWNPRFCCYFEFVSLFSPLSNYLNGGYLWFRPSLFYDHQMVLLAWKGKYESSLFPWRFTTNNRCKFNDCSNPREWC